MEPIPICRPFFGEAESRAAADVVASGQITGGPAVAAMEAAVCRVTEAPHAIAVSSGTAALELVLRALGIGPGHAVVVPSYSFVATASAVCAVGAVPCFADVDPATGNLDADSVSRVADRFFGVRRPPGGAALRAVVAVHQFGHPADMDALSAVADRLGVPLIEDAACALGSRDAQGTPIGRPRGIAACFSFHPRKVVTCGEGGVVTTGDPSVARAVRTLRQHGRPPEQPTDVRAVGTNAKLTDIQAAVATVQIDKLPRILDERRNIATRYDDAFAPCPGLTVPVPSGAPNWQTYALGLPDRARRDALIAALRAAHIAAMPAMVPIHTLPAYAQCPAVPLPHTEHLAATRAAIPLYAGMTDAQIQRVIDAVRRWALD